jgi:hypothetical protein
MIARPGDCFRRKLGCKRFRENPGEILGGRPARAPTRAGLFSWAGASSVREPGDDFRDPHESGTARRLFGEIFNPSARARLLEIASLLDADADALDRAGHQDAEVRRD